MTQISPALLAVQSIVKNNFASFPGRVDFVFCEKKHGNAANRMLVNKLMQQNKKSLSIKVKTCGVSRIVLETSSVLFFDSATNFKESAYKIIWQSSKSIRFRHLVYILNGTVDDVTSSIQNGWLIDNVAFLFNETRKSIDLTAFYMFTDKKCHDNQHVTINSFKTDTKTWENDQFFPKKYRNLHKCTLTVLKRSMDWPDSYDRTIETMSEVLNFRIKEVSFKSNEKFFHHVYEETFDFAKYDANFDDPNFQFIFMHFEQKIFIIPSGQSLTQIEKLMSPFDSAIWAAIGATLTFVLVLTQLISLMSKRVKSLCFGNNIGSPTMNLLSIFLCGGQTQAPKSFLARFIFWTILVWSLIIRTCFQSLSYRALQLDNRRPPMKTISDLLHNNFTQFCGLPASNVSDFVLETQLYR